MSATQNKPDPLPIRVLACSCEKTIAIDAAELTEKCGTGCKVSVSDNLCRSQLAVFETALQDHEDGKLIVTCTQEASLFSDIVNENDAPTAVSFVNIRENAGWSDEGHKAGAKMAALVAAARFQPTPTGLLELSSSGACLVYGAGQAAIQVAQRLAERLDVTLVLSNLEDALAPMQTRFAVFTGRISRASGHIGAFEIDIAQCAPLRPSSRGKLEFSDARDRLVKTDLVFDMSGGAPLIGANHGRDGYKRVDPGDIAGLERAMFEIVDLVGEFEKPLFVSHDPGICAHSRNGKVGCSHCVDSCPTSAIISVDGQINVTNEICDGCGHCAAGCPTGAANYLMPQRQDLLQRGRIMLSHFLTAGGERPVVLLHETAHGGDLIGAMARYGAGLSANVLPLDVYSITHVGHELVLGLICSGAQSVVLLSPVKKREALQTLEFQVALANAFIGGLGLDDACAVVHVNTDDPDSADAQLAELPAGQAPEPMAFTASGSKREVARLALANLNKMARHPQQILDLPDGAPYGCVEIDSTACTLCLACVGACPAGALGDNPDRPLVSFTESACVQCGLCAKTCPENAITLAARYNFETTALSARTLNSDEPLACTRCGKPFGSRAAIDKVIGILAGTNPMFESSAQLELLKMCEDCRVIAMSETESAPMAFGTVPRPKTAGDIDDDSESGPTRH